MEQASPCIVFEKLDWAESLEAYRLGLRLRAGTLRPGDISNLAAFVNAHVFATGRAEGMENHQMLDECVRIRGEEETNV